MNKNFETVFNHSQEHRPEVFFKNLILKILPNSQKSTCCRPEVQHLQWLLCILMWGISKMCVREIFWDIYPFLSMCYREKAPSNITTALTKSMNIWVAGTSNQLFCKRSLNWNKIFKKIKWLLAKLRFSW